MSSSDGAHLLEKITVTKGERCYDAMPQMELFSVVIDNNTLNNIDGEKKKRPRGELGTIVVINGFGSAPFDDREIQDSESIPPGESALIKGPPRFMYACDSFLIDVDLWYKVKGQYDDDVEVFRGKLRWNTRDCNRNYNRPITTIIDGNSCSATVTYVVLSAAVLARVEVTLLDLDGQNSADISGLIEASSDTGRFIYESALFRVNSDKGINVPRGGLIPLSRSAVAIHKNSSVNVLAKLYARYKDGSQDLEIVSSTAAFPALYSGTSEVDMSGRYGVIRVKVTWSC